MSFGKRKQPKREDPLAVFRQKAIASPDESSPDTVFEHEEEAARIIGGSRHRGSGASPWMKSDASSDRYQLECKQTAHASMTMQWEWLAKISMEAAGQGKTPGMHLRFLRDVPGVSQDWVMVPAREFERLLKGE